MATGHGKSTKYLKRGPYNKYASCGAIRTTHTDGLDGLAIARNRWSPATNMLLGDLLEHLKLFLSKNSNNEL